MRCLQRVLLGVVVVVLSIVTAHAQGEFLEQWDDDLAARAKAPSQNEFRVVSEGLDVFGINQHVIYEGRQCASGPMIDNQGNKTAVIVKNSITFPAGIVRATVFQNGWQTNYRFFDNHVVEISSAITHSRFVKDTLEWLSVGGILDADRNDFDWCQDYVAIGVSATADQWLPIMDGGQEWEKWPWVERTYVVSNTGAGKPTRLSGEIPRPQDMQQRWGLSLLPRGFRLQEVNDHHVLHFAYSKGKFLPPWEPPPPQGTCDPGQPECVTPLPEEPLVLSDNWASQGIFKDDDTPHFKFTEYNIGFYHWDLRLPLTPADTGVAGVYAEYDEQQNRDWEKRFEPVDCSSNIIIPRGPIANINFTKKVVLKNVLLRTTLGGDVSKLGGDVRLPVLAGWDLSFVCDPWAFNSDNQVHEIGARITNIQITPESAERASISFDVEGSLYDMDGEPPFAYGLKYNLPCVIGPTSFHPGSYAPAEPGRCE